VPPTALDTQGFLAPSRRLFHRLEQRWTSGGKVHGRKLLHVTNLVDQIGIFVQIHWRVCIGIKYLQSYQ
jgi:hypothetical protein